jgi:hypothetical protein
MNAVKMTGVAIWTDTAAVYHPSSQTKERREYDSKVKSLDDYLIT